MKKTKVKEDGLGLELKGKEIITYIRENACLTGEEKTCGNPVGCFVAKRVGDNVYVGWSFISKKEVVPFNKKKAVEIALGRAVTHAQIHHQRMNDIFDRRNISYLPYSFYKRLGIEEAQNVLNNLFDRCKRYFKVEKSQIHFLDESI